MNLKEKLKPEVSLRLDKEAERYPGAVAEILRNLEKVEYVDELTVGDAYILSEFATDLVFRRNVTIQNIDDLFD